MTDGTPVAVVAGGYTSGINFWLGVPGEYEFGDEFDDGILNPNWTYVKSAWSESGGALVVRLRPNSLICL